MDESAAAFTERILNQQIALAVVAVIRRVSTVEGVRRVSRRTRLSVTLLMLRWVSGKASWTYAVGKFSRLSPTTGHPGHPRHHHHHRHPRCGHVRHPRRLVAHVPG